jgi:hypothetical protein
VSEDGSKVVSDPGFGLIVSGWGGSPPPPPPPTCADGCKSDTCFTASCVNGACQKTPANEGGSCGDNNAQCGGGVCKGGACSAPTDGKPCTPDDKCQEDPGQCQGAKCVSKKKDLGEPQKSGLGFEVKFPEDLVSRLNDWLHFIPGLGGVNFVEGTISPEVETKDCCNKDTGVQKDGEKSGSAEVSLTANVKDVPLFGAGFAQRVAFRFPGVSGFVAVVAGLAFNTDFAFDVKAGHRSNSCENKDCFFGSIDAALQPGFKLTITNIDCITISGFFSDTTLCSRTEITPASIEGAVKIGARIHIPDCDAGLQGFISMGNIKIKALVKIPGFPEISATFQPPGFQGVTCSLPGGCSLN